MRVPIDSACATSAVFARTCQQCHTLFDAGRKVGPDLNGLLQRVYIAGVLRNDADSLVAWIVDPPKYSPRTAMPPTGASEVEARDIAAYLYAN